MRTGRLIEVALQSIRKNSLRTFLTMLGIIIGVGAVMLMVAVGQGAQSEIKTRIANLGSNLVVITPAMISESGARQAAGAGSRLTIDDFDALKRESMLLVAVSPIIAIPSQIVGGSGNWRAMVNGVDHSYTEVRDWPVASGRFFDDGDLRSMRKVIVIGQTVATNLFRDQDPLGQQLRVRDVPFEIIGVLSRKGQTAEGRDQDDVVLMPYTTARTRLASRQFIPQILGSTATAGEIAAAQDEVRAILREKHGLQSYEEDDFIVRNQTELADAAQSTARVMTMLLAAIASISLLVGGIGIMNIMLVSVTERTREVGIRMAVGARGSDVLKQFLVESIVISAVGGALGLLLGFGGARVVGEITGWNTAVSVSMITIALGFSVAVGVFFGFYPARRAAGMNPLDALRHE